MKSVLKALLPLAAVPFLFGCDDFIGSDDDKVKRDPVDNSHLTFQPGTHPQFDPGSSVLPFNNDLIFAGADERDGTADVGGSMGNLVLEALNALDGFSTSAPFDIIFEGSLDPDSLDASGVSPDRNVFLLPVDTGDGGPLDISAMVGLQTDKIPEISVKVLSLDGGTDNVLRVIPEETLEPATKYLVAITDGIEDDQGDPITRSWAYNAIRSPNASISGGLLPVRAAIGGWEQLGSEFISNFLGNFDQTVTPEEARERIKLSYTFTTTDPHRPLIAMGGPRAAIAFSQIQEGEDPNDAVQNVKALEAGQLLPTPGPRTVGIDAASGFDPNELVDQLAENIVTLYTGFLELPYYQTAHDPDDATFSFRGLNWEPNFALADSLEAGLPDDAKVTWRFPFAEEKEVVSVPLQLTLPEANHEPDGFEGATCEQIRPDGYPVVIYIHGITSDRSSVLSVGHSLADNACIATVAIDLPMHGIAAESDFVGGLNVEQGVNPATGQAYADIYDDDLPRERHFNVRMDDDNNPAEMEFGAEPVGTSGDWFINLTQLQNTRDNMRQAVMDLLNLNASLQAISDLDVDGNGTLDLENISVVGLSLGGIVGTAFAAANEEAMNNVDGVNATAPSVELDQRLNRLKNMLISAAGSQVSQILTDSPAFQGDIEDALSAVGAPPGTSNFERFIYAAQSAVASADSVNFAEKLAGDAGIPVLLQQIDGDLVMPNSVDDAPLAGTRALATLLDANQFGAEADQDLSENGWINLLNIGHHASLVTPNDPMVTDHDTAELQTQMVTFVTNAVETTIGGVAPGDIEQP